MTVKKYGRCIVYDLITKANDTKSTLLPGNDLIFQTKASFSGAYEAEPNDVLKLGLVASDGTGSSISTFVAVLCHKNSNPSNYLYYMIFTSNFKTSIDAYVAMIMFSTG